MSWKDDFIVLDSETTGFSCKAQILELGLARIVKGQVASKFVALVNPAENWDWEEPETRQALEVNQLKVPVLKTMPTLDQYSRVLQELLDGKVWVGHNIEFDERMLNQSLGTRSPVPGLLIDTLLCDVGVRPGKYSRKLGNVAIAWEIKTSNAHRSMGDVMTTFGILMKLIDKLPEDSEEIRNKQKLWKEDWEVSRQR